MLNDPNSWPNHFKKSVLFMYQLENRSCYNVYRSVASLVLTTIYGMDSIQSENDPLVVRINVSRTLLYGICDYLKCKLMHVPNKDLIYRLARACIPGTFVDVFPVLKRLPVATAPWKKEAMEWHRKYTLMFQELMDQVKSQLVSKILFESFARNIHNFTKTESRRSKTKLCCWAHRKPPAQSERSCMVGRYNVVRVPLSVNL
jgi:hypothetical protein